MHSSVAANVAAPPDLVYGLVADVSRWERLLPHYTRSRLLRRERDGSVVCEFVARRPLVSILGVGVPVAWRSRTWADPVGLTLRFRHLAGATQGMDVTWRFEASSNGTHLTIEHVFERRLPFLGPDAFPRLVDRYFVRPIAARTLATVTVLAEALATSERQPPAYVLA